jgi:hypothetical protein
VKNFRPPYGDCDDRVRAIATALGYRTIFWSDDSQDTSRSSATPPPAVISDWFLAQPGFISLEHDISVTTVQIAINALAAARRTTLGSIPQPVSQCQGIAPSQWYKNGGASGGGGTGGAGGTDGSGGNGGTGGTDGTGGGGTGGSSNGGSGSNSDGKSDTGSAGKNTITFLLASVGLLIL